MRKSKPIVADQISDNRRSPVIRPHDDGILAVPIAPEDREQAHEEMQKFINHHKEHKPSSK
ncbi:hypothetical protein SAMN04487969_13312 [Paenibacillus algorifonticola]|uniref:Uncharacterized protein n=1 Tax=Paenibacillus algorifonticola TaxID=684063 RepID=A0A1I2ICY7_9BACL|nr:hypothetical protein [Paenibacillus algorifonticola]SFF39490.1 hypothetical protein SAMN04487969_13312 [Paenibacillus algorifonticola]